MGIVDDYYILYEDDGLGDKPLTPRTSLYNVCLKLYTKLKLLNCASLYRQGEFIQTEFKAFDITKVKRYAIRILFPRITLTIIKKSKGDIDKDVMWSTMKYIEENYEKICNRFKLS